VSLAGGREAEWDTDGTAGLEAQVMCDGMLVGYVPQIEGSEDFDEPQIVDAIAHDLGFEASRAVGVPLGFAAAGQRHTDAELVDAAAEQVSVDTTVTKSVDHPPGPEFVHDRDPSARS